MVELPCFYDVILRIEYRDELRDLVTYQRVNIAKFSEIKKRFSSNTKFFMLVFRPNRMYGWVPLFETYVDGTIRCQEITTEIRGASVLAPTRYEVTWASPPLGIFRSDKPSLEEWALGLYHLDNMKLQVRQAGLSLKHPIDPKRYIRDTYVCFRDREVKWYLDGREFDYRETYNMLEDVGRSYVEEYYGQTSEVYLTHMLLRANVLVPLFLNYNINPTGIHRYPIETFWLYQLLYSHSHDIFYTLSNGTDVHLSDLKMKGKSNQVTVPRVIFRTNGWLAKPVVIYKNVAMRFKNDGNQKLADSIGAKDWYNKRTALHRSSNER